MFYKGLLKEHMLVLSWFTGLVDLLLFLISGLLAFYFQFQHLYFDRLYITSFVFAALLILPVFSFFKMYKSFFDQSLLRYLVSLYLAVVSVMVLLAAVAFITKTGSYFSRAWFCIWTANAIVLLTVFRLLLWYMLRMMRKHGWNQRRIIIIGAGTVGQSLIERVGKAFWSGFKIVDVFDDGSTQKGKGYICDINVKKMPNDIEKYIKENVIDEVWLALPLKAESKIKKIVKALCRNIIIIRYFPDMFSLNLLNYSVTEIFGLSTINVVSSPMIGINRIVKAIEDRVFALLILLFLSPFMLVIAMLVKLSSPGTVFFRQERMGWNGRKFNMLKFRSMPVDAEINTGAVWAHEKDNRATKFGSFLRKTSLDELPQFINVLRGDMSIVGPRPERPVFVNKFKYDIPNYMQKHLVKAGITGWAQVNGWRGNTSLEKRIEYDIYYIENWSLWFDVKIILLTLIKGFVHKNAY